MLCRKTRDTGANYSSEWCPHPQDFAYTQSQNRVRQQTWELAMIEVETGDGAVLALSWRTQANLLETFPGFGTGFSQSFLAFVSG
jgi:hypothetical protein